MFLHCRETNFTIFDLSRQALKTIKKGSIGMTFWRVADAVLNKSIIT